MINKYRCYLALGMLTLTLCSHAQLPVKGALPATLPSPALPRLSEKLSTTRHMVQEQTQDSLKQAATGPQALLDDIPDANTLLPDTVPIEIRNQAGQTLLTEVYIQQGWRVLQQEWLLLLNKQQRQALDRLPFKVLSETPLPRLNMLTARIRVSAQDDKRSAVLARLSGLGIEVVERHHVYDVQAAMTEANSAHAGSRQPEAAKAFRSPPGPLRIGLIDTAIDLNHPGLASATIHQQTFVEPELNEPFAHGTAVLGRLVGQSPSVKPLLPEASVFAASVFYQKDAYSQSAPTLALLQALDWLLAMDVQVINMSLAGPPNTLLEKALHTVRAQGVAVVAASGNAGPAARPLFPAAYPSVIAVSAVDQNKHIYRWANRGKHIDFVAPGVDIVTLRAGGGEGRESGTSMATPALTAALARKMQAASLEASLASLIAIAEDLGAPGRDVIFGEGLIAPAP